MLRPGGVGASPGSILAAELRIRLSGLFVASFRRLRLPVRSRVFLHVGGVSVGQSKHLKTAVSGVFFYETTSNSRFRCVAVYGLA